MSFFLVLESAENEIALTAEGPGGEEVKLVTTPLAFTPWSIMFRDFLRLLAWFPHSPAVTESILDFFREPFVLPDETGAETHFRLESEQSGGNFFPQLLIWQPARAESAFAIHAEASYVFLNVLAFGLARRNESDFIVNADELEDEDLFQYHGELRRIEDQFRATGLAPFWVTPEIQRLLAVGRAYDLGLSVDGIPTPLLHSAEGKVLSSWDRGEMENLIRFASDLERHWGQQFRLLPNDSGDAIIALENWIFALNLLGFIDRFIAGVLPTRMPNPVAPLLSFLLERFFITQWESNLWPARRSALEDTYRDLIPFLIS